MLVRISHPGGPVKGRIHISGSKSISNRALILSALCAERKEISNLSDSDDTQTLRRLLLQSKLKAESNYDAHHAGTTFRFMTAYLAMQEGVQILTGSERMQQRPIGPLVDALNEIGADISYEKKSGYPPLRIGPFKSQEKNQIEIRSDISSQFLSSLCMIAPTLEKGLTIRLRGQLVSKPYLEMTLKMMETYGVLAEFDGEIILPSHNLFRGVRLVIGKLFFFDSCPSAGIGNYFKLFYG